MNEFGHTLKQAFKIFLAGAIILAGLQFGLLEINKRNVRRQGAVLKAFCAGLNAGNVDYAVDVIADQHRDAVRALLPPGNYTCTGESFVSPNIRRGPKDGPIDAVQVDLARNGRPYGGIVFVYGGLPMTDIHFSKLISVQAREF